MNSEHVIFEIENKKPNQIYFKKFLLIFKIQPYKHQDYERLKSIHNGHNLFIDDLFPACDSSIYKKQPVPANVVWKRPLVKNILCYLNIIKEAQIFKYQ